MSNHSYTRGHRIKLRVKFFTMCHFFKGTNQAAHWLQNSCSCFQIHSPPLDMLQEHSNVRRLRSNSLPSHSFVELRTQCSTFAARSFSCYGPRIWNQLPEHINCAGSIETSSRDSWNAIFLILCIATNCISSFDSSVLLYFCAFLRSVLVQILFWLRR